MIGKQNRESFGGEGASERSWEISSVKEGFPTIRNVNLVI